MPAKDLGSKFVCFKCSTKFYDMKKPDPVCPKCGADQRESAANKPPTEGRRSRLAAVPKVAEPVEAEEPAAAASPAAEGDEEEIETFEEEEEPEAAEAEEDI